jgi:hypothetical protein
MVEKSQMVKHIQIRQDTITPKDRRKKPFPGREYIVIDGQRYRYVGAYFSAEGAEKAWRKDYFDKEYVIIPYGGWGNPATPGLFVSAGAVCGSNGE